MDKINIEEKRKGSKFTASDCNSMVGKINEVVDALNGSESVQRKVYIQNNMDGKSFASQKGEPCILDFTFVSQERYGYDTEYENTGERGTCQVYVKNVDFSDYTLVRTFYVNSNVSTKLDVAEYLSTGANSVMLRCTGEITEVITPAYTYTIQLTSLSIAASNFRWWQAFTGVITLPLLIGGNVSKILYVELMGEGVSESYSRDLGNAVYTDTAYNYMMPHPGKSGVYRIKAYLTNSDGTIRTRSVEYNIICTRLGDVQKLMCINNVASGAKNWAENILFEYAIYDGEAVNTSADFEVEKNFVPVYSSKENAIPTHTRNTFSLPLEIETPDDKPFSITLSVMDNNVPLISEITIPVDNSAGYSAVAGSVFYLNPKMRSNAQGNAKKIINEAGGAEIACTWQNMNWSSDGWSSDANGSKVLRLMAGSNASIDYKPFAVECARKGKTIELDYRIFNVTDYSEPVIKISAPSNNQFVGLNIYANEIFPCSQSLTNGDTQSIPTDDGVRIRATLVIMPNVYGNLNFNLCSIYINGKKNRTFMYESNDYWAHNGNIVIGSNNADIDLYGLRIYDNGLSATAVHKNYINWLPTTEDKAAEVENNTIYNALGTQIDFNAVKAKKNVFVFDNVFPSYTDTAKRIGTLSIYYAEHPQRSIPSITNVEMSGQGTSSKKYLEWNEKVKVDKIKSIITYADGTTTTKKFRMFQGVPLCSSVTFKKNWASSMQDHKAASVNAYTDIYKKMGLTNEAMALDPEVRVSVYQEPFIAFQKTVNEEGETVYTCMGEFTGGPDKGDKDCFGFNTDKFPGLISVEGSDNAPLPALFRVPWNNTRMIYNEDEEAWQYNDENCWDFGGGDLNNISKFIPAYNLVYQCSPRLKPFNGTLDELNAQVIALRASGYEYWIAKAGDVNQYNVYYYEASEKQFIGSSIGQGVINLITQLIDYLDTSSFTAFTDEQKNELFISSRVAKFRAEAPGYWDIADAMYHHNFTEFIAATDNRAKNTYPYCFGNSGSLFKWRQDDLDSILPVTNQGQLRKGYGVEVHDFYDNGGAVFNGNTSNFWNLLEMAFNNELFASMRKMLTAMEELGGFKSGTHAEKLYAWYTKYYLGVKGYFPAASKNEDARRYENAKLAQLAGIYTNDTDPLTQSLGDLYSCETAWIKKRIQYMMSKYSFGAYSANGTDSINVRAAGNEIVYEITPAIDMYPAIANGTSIIRGARTKAGQVCRISIDLGGSGDQQNVIQGASYLTAIGKWYNKNVTGNLIVKGKMLRELEIGSKTEEIVISISDLTLSDTVSLQTLMLSNVVSLTGALDLTACTHLRKVWADGTSLSQLKLPQGGCLEYVEYPSASKYLILKNYPLLKADGVKLNLCAPGITDFFIQDCPQLNPMDLLVQVMNAQAAQEDSHALKAVRAVGFDSTYYAGGTQILDMVAKLAGGSYIGLNSEGLAGEDPYPVLDGKLTINANTYEDSLNTLRSVFKRLVLNVTGEFYIRFRDPEVQRIAIAAWGDGMGLTQTQARTVTNIRDVFKDNKQITCLDELQFFGITGFGGNFISGLKRLRSVVLPHTVTYTELNNLIVAQNIEYLHIQEGDTGLWCSGGSNSGIDAPRIKKMVLPARTTNFNSYSFRAIFCDEIYITALTPPSLTLAYGDGVESRTLHVPNTALEAYKSATNYSRFKAIVGFDKINFEIEQITSVTQTRRYSAITLMPNIAPVDAIYSLLDYTIISGAEYATLSDNILYAKPNTMNQPVTVRISSQTNKNVYYDHTTNVTHYPASYFDSMITKGSTINPFTLDYYANKKTKIVMSFNSVTQPKCLFGSTSGNWYKDSFYAMVTPQSEYIMVYGTTQHKPVRFTNNQDVVLSFSKGVIVFNEVEYPFIAPENDFSAHKLIIGDINMIGNRPQPVFNGIFYNCKVYEGEQLIYDLYPIGNGLVVDLVNGVLQE